MPSTIKNRIVRENAHVCKKKMKHQPNFYRDAQNWRMDFV